MKHLNINQETSSEHSPAHPPRPPHRMLRRAEVQNRIGLARSTIYQRVAEGTLPAPVRLGGARAVAWVEDEINAWIEQQIVLSRASNCEKGAGK